MNRIISLIVSLVFIGQSVLASDYDKSNKGRLDALQRRANNRELIMAEKQRMAQQIQAALSKSTKLDPTQNMTAEQQEELLKNQFLDAQFDQPSKLRTRTVYWARFGTGNGGFMLGSQILCGLKAMATNDPMVWDGCVDHFLSIDAWRDLLVFSVGSHMATDLINTLKRSLNNPALRRMVYSNIITKLMSEIFLTTTANGLVVNGLGMTAGSVLQHFFIKYINSKELEQRKINHTEWGYWFNEHNLAKLKLQKINNKLRSTSVTQDEKAELVQLQSQYELYQKVANEKLQKHRAHWDEYFWKSFKKFYTFEDAKEKQQFWIDTGVMLATTAAVAGGHAVVNKAYGAAMYQLGKNKVKDVAAFTQTMTDVEKKMVFNKYFSGIDKLDKKAQQEAAGFILEQRYKAKAKDAATSIFLSQNSSLRLNDIDRAFVQGPGPQMNKHGKPAGYITKKEYLEKTVNMTVKRKLYATFATGAKWTALAAANAVAWLGVNELFNGWYKDIGYLATLNYAFIPFWGQPIDTSSMSKQIKMYSLDDRIKDAKAKLVAAAETVVKPEIPLPENAMSTYQKEVEKRKIIEKLVSFQKDHDGFLEDVKTLNAAIDNGKVMLAAIHQQAVKESKNKDSEMSKYTEADLDSMLNTKLKQHYEESHKITSENDKLYQESYFELVELKKNGLAKLKALGFNFTPEQLDVEISHMKANPYIPDETHDYPDKYKEFLKALNEFHDVFRLYREEVILRDFQTHYMTYQQKLEKLQTENYKRTRYLQWFLRGEKENDPDFVYNGSTDTELVAAIIDDIQKNQDSPLYGAEVGRKWHFDPEDEAGSLIEETEKIRKETIAEITARIKWENSKRAIKTHDLSLQNVWTPQNILNVILKHQNEMADELGKMQKTLLASLKKSVEKVIPSKENNVEESKLQRSYEREFVELQSAIYEISKLTPQAPVVATLNQALKLAEQKCDINNPKQLVADNSSGTRMFCDGFIQQSVPLTKRLKDFTPQYVKFVLGKDSMDLRAEAVMLQVFNYIVQIKKTRDLLPKQREMILALDLSSLGELNMEDVLENKEIPAPNALKRIQEKNKDKKIGEEKF